MKLIALHGDSGCGKNTIADGLGWAQVAFATPLRLWVYSKHGFDISRLGDKDYEDEHGILPLLIQGSEDFRRLYPGLVLNYALLTIANLNADVVITDLRFPYELTMLQCLGAECIHVIRPEASRPVQAMDRLINRRVLRELMNVNLDKTIAQIREIGQTAQQVKLPDTEALRQAVIHSLLRVGDEGFYQSMCQIANCHNDGG